MLNVEMRTKHKLIIEKKKKNILLNYTFKFSTYIHTGQPVLCLDVLSDRAVQAKYWLPRAEIQRLITLVSPHIQRATYGNFALSPEVQLLAALPFFAVGSFLEVVGHGTSLSKASVSRSMAAVTHIKMPTTRNDCVIVVTTMLHNIAVRVGANEPPPVDDEEEHSEDEAPNPAPHHQAGAQTRQELINLTSHQALITKP